jgi:hypothetical protein
LEKLHTSAVAGYRRLPSVPMKPYEQKEKSVDRVFAAQNLENRESETNRLQIKIGRVTIFSLSRKQVQIEIAYKPTTLSLIIPDAEYLDIFVPDDVTTLARLG